MPFSLTVILSERLNAFLQIKQSLMVGRLNEMHVMWAIIKPKYTGLLKLVEIE